MARRDPATELTWLVRYVIPLYVALALVGVGIAIFGGLANGLAPGAENGCKFHVGAAVSLDDDFFSDEVAPGCADLSLDEARTTIYWDMAFAFVYGSSGTFLLGLLWPRAWRIGLVRKKLRWAAWLPTLTMAFDVVENAFVLSGLTRDGTLRLSETAAIAAGVAGWWKWMLAILAAAALVATVCGAIGNRRLPQPPGSDPAPSPPKPMGPDEIGICLSGGGIRSASFATGGLRALDDVKLFEKAGRIAAVSGGAYAAGAWSIARGSAADAPGVEPQPAGGRDRLLDPPAGAPNLFEYLRANRRYLATGRGGIPANAIVGTLLVALNLLVLAVLVFLVAWPLGRLMSSWAIQPDLQAFEYGEAERQSLGVPPRLWLPGLFGFAVAGAASIVSLVLWEPARKVVLTVAAAFAGGGLVLLGLLVGAPVATAEMPGVWTKIPAPGDGGAGVVSILTALGVTGALVRLLSKPLAKNAPRLGGVLVAVLAFLLAGKVATDAAYRDGAMSLDLSTYGLVLAGFASFYSLANAQSWSLFRIYYSRLRSTFATTQDAGERAGRAPGRAGVYPRSLAAEPDWPAYAGRPGPKLLVCAAAQRNSNDVTGVPALTFTFSDDEIGLRDVAWDQTQKFVRNLDHAAPSGSYLAHLRRPGPLGPRLGSVSAAMAMSGAAFTSAMGRQSLGSTNSLLAALNLRLGMWMPNPRYTGGDPRPFKRPRVSYLLKELFGVYDPDDPYVYVSDGGHWENLGLVELVRRRCKWIFCLDASGDAPDSFQTLEEARIMARMECGAEIHIDTKDMRKPERGLPKAAWTVGIVRYHAFGELGPDDCEIGLLFYGKALVAENAPINTLSFSLRDKIYPRYPTYDQFLDEEEFDNLVRLGEWVASGLAWEYAHFTNAQRYGDRDALLGSRAFMEAFGKVDLPPD